MNSNRRIGKFFVDGRDIFEGRVNADFFSMLNFVPYRVEHLAHTDQFEYIGTSDLFDAIAPGMIFREYKITVTQDSDYKLIGVSVE